LRVLAYHPPTRSLRRIWRGLTDKREHRPCFSIVATVLFCVALSLVHYNHELWRDEIHCWSVGRNARGLWDLLIGIRRYDGHPFLWYYLLHLVSLWSRSQVYLHVVAVVIATLSSYLWLRRSGLPRIFRLLLLCTYFYFFEYNVMSRSYGLGLLLAFLFCHLYDSKVQRVFPLLLVLLVLSFTSAYGAIIAAALGALVLWQSIGRLRSAEVDSKEKRALYRQWSLGLVVLAFGLFVHIKTSLPPADAYYSADSAHKHGWISLSDFSMRFWSALFPWNAKNDGRWIVSGYVGETWPLFKRFMPIVGCATLWLWLIALRKAPAIAAAYLLGVVMMAAFQFIQYPGYLRHWGHFFILLVVCVWLYTKHANGKQTPALLYGLLALTLVVQTITGIRAVKTEIELPFSSAQEAANFLRDHGLKDVPIFATYDHAASAVAGYLDGRFISVESGEEGQTVVFHNRRYEPTTAADVAALAHPVAQETHAPVLMLLNFDLAGEPIPGFTTELLYATKPSIRLDETFWIYRLTEEKLPP
jgi:hypothetical protein